MEDRVERGVEWSRFSRAEDVWLVIWGDLAVEGRRGGGNG